MPPQRPPSSPTSLLWAHQLKREHGFLLNRMKKLEEEIAGVESRTLEVVGAARPDDVAAIASQVQRLTDDGGHAAMEKIRGEVMKRFEGVGAEIEAVTLQVSNIERGQEGLREEWGCAVEMEKDLLMRIKEVEGSVKEYERGVMKLGKKIDDQAIGKIREALAGLSEDVKSEKIGLEMVQASLDKLDEAGKVLREGNERLAEQVKELAEKTVPVSIPQPAVTPTNTTEPATTPQESEQDGGSMETPPLVQKSKATKKAAAKAATQASRKPAPRRAATKTKPSTARGVAAIKKPATGAQIDKRLKVPIVRRGRGWIEVVEEPDDEEDETVPDTSVVVEPVKRRGRPPNAKAAAPPAVDATTSTAVPTVKRGPGRPRKNAPKADSATLQTLVQSEQHNTGTASAVVAPKRGPGRPRNHAVEADSVSLQTVVEPVERDVGAAASVSGLKRGPGRPRKNASQAAPAIVQTDDTRRPMTKSLKKRTIDQADEDAYLGGRETSRGQQKRGSGDTPEPLPMKRRRGLTNIFTSPLSSSNSPVIKSIENVPESSRPAQVFQSETSQPTPRAEKENVEVKHAKRRMIVQLDDMGVLRAH